MFIVALLALPGCAESVESENVFTDGVYAELRASATANGTLMRAILVVGGSDSNTYLELTGGDSLSVTAGAETKELRAQRLGDRYHYTSNLAVVEEDTEVVFRFERSIDDGAPDSRCTMPRPTRIDAPVEGDTFSRVQDAVVITWDTSGSNQPIELEVTGDCFTTLYQSFEDDPGSHTIEAETLASIEDPATACQATVTLSRTTSGSLDPGFGEGGSVVCIQSRSTTFRSEP
jgi:hypothetical protein